MHLTVQVEGSGSLLPENRVLSLTEKLCAFREAFLFLYDLCDFDFSLKLGGGGGGHEAGAKVAGAGETRNECLDVLF